MMLHSITSWGQPSWHGMTGIIGWHVGLVTEGWIPQSLTPEVQQCITVSSLHMTKFISCICKHETITVYAMDKCGIFFPLNLDKKRENIIHKPHHSLTQNSTLPLNTQDPASWAQLRFEVWLQSYSDLSERWAYLTWQVPKDIRKMCSHSSDVISSTTIIENCWYLPGRVFLVFCWQHCTYWCLGSFYL